MRKTVRTVLAVVCVLASGGCHGERQRADTAAALTPVLSLDFEDADAGTAGLLPAGFDWLDSSNTARAELDTAAHGGRRALTLQQATPNRAASLAYVIPDSLWHGATSVHVRGWIRTSGIQGGWASVWVRADGADRVAADSLPPDRRPGPLAIDLMQGRGPTGTSGWEAYEASVPVAPATRRIVVGPLLAGTGTAQFDDLAVLVARADVPPSAEALAYARLALDTMRALAYHRASVPWDSLDAALPSSLRGARTRRDTYATLQAIAMRVDRHSSLLKPEELASFYRDTSGTGELPAVELPRSNMVAPRIGYVAVPPFAGLAAPRTTKYAEALQAALAGLDRRGACGYVVDLRPNTGGNMYPMIAGLGPLLGDSLLGSMVDRSGPRSSWRYRSGAAVGRDSTGDTVLARVSRPVQLREPGAPVAVLIGPATASSGEAVAISFRGRPATRFFGQPTAGFTTGNIPILLPDSAAINLTVSAEADRAGTVYDGPILPDSSVADRAGEEAGDPVITAAVSWVARQPGCQGAGPGPR